MKVIFQNWNWMQATTPQIVARTFWRYVTPLISLHQESNSRNNKSIILTEYKPNKHKPKEVQIPEQ